MVYRAMIFFISSYAAGYKKNSPIRFCIFCMEDPIRFELSGSLTTIPLFYYPGTIMQCR